MVWRPSKDGIFKVKTAYHLEMDKIRKSQGETSAGSFEQPTWKSLWKSNVPGSVKYFLWKACHDLLPTRKNLFIRKEVEGLLCPICEREEELAIHTLWSCPASSDVWGEESSPLKKWSDADTNVWELWQTLIEKL